MATHALRDVGLIVQIMPERAAGVRDPGVEQNARAFQTRRADHHDARLGVHFALRMPIDEIGAVDQARCSYRR